MATAKEEKKKIDDEILKKFKNSAEEIIETVEKKQNPKIKIPLRGLTNVYFD